MSDLSISDGIGFSAAGLVLVTFCMRSMRALRWVAIASNVAFIAYAYLEGLAPVLLLHALLLPVNICRLVQLRGARDRSDPTAQRPSGGTTPSLVNRQSLLRRAVRRALRHSAGETPG